MKAHGLNKHDKIAREADVGAGRLNLTTIIPRDETKARWIRRNDKRM